jgi:hypothetical protein
MGWSFHVTGLSNEQELFYANISICLLSSKSVVDSLKLIDKMFGEASDGSFYDFEIKVGNRAFKVKFHSSFDQKRLL